MSLHVCGAILPFVNHLQYCKEVHLKVLRVDREYSSNSKILPGADFESGVGGGSANFSMHLIFSMLISIELCLMLITDPYH